MLLSITTTHQPATDLGYLLHKHPDNVRSASFPFGQVHVFFPEASIERCTATLLMEIDPVGLVRRGGGYHKNKKQEVFALAGYVNDRPYVASSFLSTALNKMFRTAMTGSCPSRPELATMAIPFEVEIPVVPSRGGPDVARRVFEPLGYRVDATPIPLDETFEDWGDSRYVTLRLVGSVRLVDLLSHLYVLLPVLDNDKHYWVGEDEVDKLLAKAEPWLSSHPDRELIVRRYLKHRRPLTASALGQLAQDDDILETEDDDVTSTDLADAATPGAPGDEGASSRPSNKADAEEELVEERISLNTQRMGTVLAALRSAGAHRVVDLGCGEGRLLELLRRDNTFTEIVGIDASHRALERASSRLHLDRVPEHQRDRIRLLHSGLTYRDRRLEGFDAATAVEVIEHLDQTRLDAFEQSVFAHARPATVIVTTPNIEYNVRFETLPAGDLRHRDHRFEWTRAEFAAWADGVAQRHDYAVRYLPIGDDDPEVGPPTQMAVFSR